MRRFRKYFVWFYMLCKRILHKWSFILLLCLVPIIIPITDVAMTQESGIVRVILCNEGADAAAEKIIRSLIEDDSVIMFSTADSVSSAEEAVREHRADTAWIFPSNFSKILDRYIAGDSIEPFVRIAERESNIPVRIAREKLFGAIYSNISYSIYKNFSYDELVSIETVSETTIKEYYDSVKRKNNIIQIEKLHSEENQKNVEPNYLTAPIRGILSLLVMLCTITGTMYFLQDQLKGRFDWLPTKKRIVPAFATCLSAACLSGLAVFVAILCSNFSTGIIRELMSMLLFIIAATGFCTLLCLLFRSPGKLAALIPGIIISMLILSPIFFNVKVLRPIRLMLPTYYYLHSIYNTSYYFYTLIYIAFVYLLIMSVNSWFINRKLNKSLI